MLQSASGQAGAEEIGVANPLTPDEIATGTDGEVAKEQGLHEATPLWYYILKEAQVREDGKRLGPVGATIVAEVLVGLVPGDHESYLRPKGIDRAPTLPSQPAGTLNMRPAEWRGGKGCVCTFRYRCCPCQSNTNKTLTPE